MAKNTLYGLKNWCSPLSNAAGDKIPVNVPANLPPMMPSTIEMTTNMGITTTEASNFGKIR